MNGRRGPFKAKSIIGNVRDTKDAAERQLANQERIIELLEQLLKAVQVRINGLRTRPQPREASRTPTT